MRTKKRLLFIGESVTLAHVVRPLTLAKLLRSDEFDIHFACNENFKSVIDLPKDITFHSIKSITPDSFMKSLYYGTCAYTTKVLKEYVNEDLKLIDQIKPNIIFGDFRLSLSISSKLKNTTFVNLTNAHWSPYANATYSLPDTPIRKLLGRKLSGYIFNFVRPIVFKSFTNHFNRTCQYFKVPAKNSLNEVYTDADVTLYLDTPSFVPTYDKPANHIYAGPVTWSPTLGLPDWFDEVREKKNNVYVTFGSSGNIKLLNKTCLDLIESGLNPLVAFAGRKNILSNDIKYYADFLPGKDMIDISRLTLCNGGSATVYQSLSRGVPVIGVPSNLDQYLTMNYVTSHGAGVLLEPENLKTGQLKNIAARFFKNDFYCKNAQKIKTDFCALDQRKILEDVIRAA